MRPDTRQRGFALVAAMFLIIVIALVIAAMARLSITQHGTNSLAIQQARAYQAAWAGLEWGVARAVNDGVCTGGSPSLADSNLRDFSLRVSCNSVAYDYVQIFRITAEAESVGPDSRADYAWRRLEVMVEQ
jgi:MSHA biogenesis protein MshP